MEKVWLIEWFEGGESKGFLCDPRCVKGGWAIQRELGIQFKREQDAEAVIHLFDLPWLCRPGVEIRAVAHEWER